MPTIVLPSVVLPQPDSPTTPTIAPRPTDSETPSTARSQPARLPHASRIAKCLCTSRSANTGPFMPPRYPLVANADDDTALDASAPAHTPPDAPPDRHP